jgi:hypothetical protein
MTKGALRLQIHGESDLPYSTFMTAIGDTKLRNQIVGRVHNAALCQIDIMDVVQQAHHYRNNSVAPSSGLAFMRLLASSLLVPLHRYIDEITYNTDHFRRRGLNL